MTIEEVIVADTVGIAPAYPQLLPVNAADECIVYQVVSAPEFEVCEYVGLRVQLSCFAKSYGGAVALGNEVRAFYYQRHVTVSGIHYRAWVQNVYDAPPETDTGRYARIVDVRFDYRNPI